MSYAGNKVGQTDLGNGEAIPELTLSEQNRVIRKTALRLIPILAFAFFINTLDKTNIGLASLQMNKALGLTTAAFGLASGLLFVGYAIFEVPSNIALYRFGARKWITRIMISWGIIASATALVDSEVTLYILRILLGIAEAGFYPGVLLYLTMWIPKQKRGQMLAWFVFGGALSGVIGSPLTGLLLTPTSYFGIEGWRAMFIFEGVPAIVVGVLCLFILRDKPADAKWLSAREKSWLTATLDAERASVVGAHIHSGSLRMIADLRVLMLSLIYFCAKFGQYALVFFLPLMIVSFETAAGHTSTILEVSLLTAIPAACSVVPGVLWAMHSDKTGERIWHAALPSFLGCVAIWASTMFHDPLLIMLAICIASIGTGSQSAPFFQLPNTFLTGVAAAASFGLINALGNLGGFVAPTVFGMLKDWTGNYTIPSDLMGVVLAIGGGLTLLFPRLLRSMNKGNELAQPVVIR